MDTQVDRTKCPGITISKAAGSRNETGQRVVRILDGYGGRPTYGVHNPSLVNLVRGIAERVLYTANAQGELEAPRQAEEGVFDILAFEKRALVEGTVPTRIVDIEDFPNLYADSRKQAIYRNAVEGLRHKPLTHQDSYVSTFVKAEKVNFSAKPDPAPRVIQPRTPRYNAVLGCYLKPLEKRLLSTFATIYGYIVVVKGLNAMGVASALRDNWENFVDPVAVGLDASRFDQHVGVQALKFEHSVYNGIFRRPELAKLLSWQLRNKGFGYVQGNKVTYTVDGCRMSGDMNTSMGNCIIMSCIVLAYFRVNSINARLTNNGDDCVVVLERRDLYKLAGLDAWFTRFGFKLTRETPVDVFEQIEFCQTQPVCCDDGWRMVRNPYTASSKDAVSLLSWADEVEFDRWRGAISMCGLSLTVGVPFWESYYAGLGGTHCAKAYQRIVDSGLGYLARDMSSKAEITPITRHSFWLAFGMTPDEQVANERCSGQVKYSVPVPMTFGDVQPYNILLK